jgi:hypothetical protein
MAITAAKRQEVVVLRPTVLAVADVATLFGGVGESCFLNRKVAKWYKYLKTVKSGDPKPKKQTIATEKRVAAAIARIPLKAAAHLRCLPGAASSGYVALDLYYLSHSHTPPFP